MALISRSKHRSIHHTLLAGTRINGIVHYYQTFQCSLLPLTNTIKWNYNLCPRSSRAEFLSPKRVYMQARNYGDVTLRSSFARVEDITWFGALFRCEAVVGSDSCPRVIVMMVERRINIKFCVKIDKSATETSDLLKVAYGESVACE